MGPCGGLGNFNSTANPNVSKDLQYPTCNLCPAEHMHLSHRCPSCRDAVPVMSKHLGDPISALASCHACRVHEAIVRNSLRSVMHSRGNERIGGTFVVRQPGSFSSTHAPAQYAHAANQSSEQTNYWRQMMAAGWSAGHGSEATGVSTCKFRNEMPPELAICILSRELPLDGLARGVAVAPPGIDFALQDLWCSEGSIQALAVEDAVDLELCHVEPTRMLGRVVEEHPRSNAPAAGLPNTSTKDFLKCMFS